jgi:hypothetical protein
MQQMQPVPWLTQLQGQGLLLWCACAAAAVNPQCPHLLLPLRMPRYLHLQVQHLSLLTLGWEPRHLLWLLLASSALWAWQQVLHLRLLLLWVSWVQAACQLLHSYSQVSCPKPEP